MTRCLQEIHMKETTAEEVSVRTSDIKEVLSMWMKFSQFIEERHPEKIATARALASCKDTCLTHFQIILKGCKKQTSLDRFTSKRPVREHMESVSLKGKVVVNRMIK